MEVQDDAGMSPSVRAILHGKCFRLLQELLAGIQFPDNCLFKDVASNLPLTGWLSATGHMQPRLCPPLLSKQELLGQFSVRNEGIWHFTRPSGDTD